MSSYDVIVLGAGAMGSAAAYYLAKAGQRVLLVEQFAIDHPNGSSFGNSRIIRYMYNHPAYVKLAKAAYPLWHAVEAEAGEKLLHIIGGLDFGRTTDPSLKDTLDAVAQHDIPVEFLTPEAAMRRYPQFSFRDDMTVVYQKDYGLLNASASVRAHVRLAQKHGARVLENTPVKNIDASAGRVTVYTEHESFSADRLVVAAGGWTNEALAPLGIRLPLQIQRVQYCFFGADRPQDYRPDVYPIFISHQYNEYEYVPYSLPDYDGAGLKMAFHGGETIAGVHAVNRTPDADAPDKLRPFLRDMLPDAANARHLQTHVCLYTMTPDQHFIIDTHADLPNVTFATPCSGHGFKFSTLIGQILADLSLEGASEHDISLFSHKRFVDHESPA